MIEDLFLFNKMEELQNEVWKTVTGFPDYEISSIGRVRSNYGESVDRILNGSIGTNGYLVVTLRSIDGDKNVKSIHKLCAMEFLDHTPSGMDIVVNHKDNNKANNNSNNLELVSQQENTRQHKTSVGVHWETSANKWRVQCSYPRSKRYGLGLYSDKDQAQAVSDLAYALILDGLTEEQWLMHLNQDGVTSRKTKIK